MEGQRRIMKQPGQSVFGPRVRPGAFLVFSFRGLCAFPYFIAFLGGHKNIKSGVLAYL